MTHERVLEKFVLHLPITPNKQKELEDEICNSKASPPSFTNVLTDVSVSSMNSTSSSRIPEFNLTDANQVSSHIGTHVLTQSELHLPKWPKTVSICCTWDGHRFDTTPIGIPLKRCNKDGVYDTIGCYCSFACAAASNLTNTRVSVTIRNERHAIISMLYRNMYKKSLRIAPSRECLRIFGGTLDINQFRDPSVCNDMILSPPFRPYSVYIKDHSSSNSSTFDSTLNEWNISMASESVANNERGLGKFMTVAFGK